MHFLNLWKLWILSENWLGYMLGDFFTHSYGHPAHNNACMSTIKERFCWKKCLKSAWIHLRLPWGRFDSFMQKKTVRVCTHQSMQGTRGAINIEWPVQEPYTPIVKLITVARFFLVQNTKTGRNIPNDHKIFQVAIKYFQWP
jgi:hypothetical protein